MIDGRLARARACLQRLFPERHLYIRSGGEMHCVALTSGRQCAVAAGAAVVSVWLTLASAAAFLNLMPLPRAAPQASAAGPAPQADPQAKLAAEVERRHEALALVISELDPEAAPADVPPDAPLAQRVHQVRQEQVRLLEIADENARERTERLKLAFRSAGLNPKRFATAERGQGGPLISLRDPKTLAATLEVDEAFAARIQKTSAALRELRVLSDAAERLPLGRPTATQRSSRYGVRSDPFTGETAFHSGMDFSGPHRTPIAATASGRVAFVGTKSGYGRTVEIDHGKGVKTRYGHLQSAAVRLGQRVEPGQRIGAMGSTGRSTGTHLHYEVWVNGRAQNPERFLRAGEKVRSLG